MIEATETQQATEETEVIAVVQGEAVTEVPTDLYIPPDALEIFLDAFEGPLDLLLYLIKRQNLDIVEISIAKITQQYMDYIALAQGMRFELAAEYLVMAAMLAEIKSRMLLPKPKYVEDDEEDPSATLIRRLQEYERFKLAAENLDELPRHERDFQIAHAEVVSDKVEKVLPQTDLRALLSALQDVLKRAEMFSKHQIQREPLSVRERMSRVLDQISCDNFIALEQFFDVSEGKMGVVVTFLAILELLKERLIEIIQTDENFGPIHVKGISA